MVLAGSLIADFRKITQRLRVVEARLTDMAIVFTQVTGGKGILRTTYRTFRG